VIHLSTRMPSTLRPLSSFVILLHLNLEWKYLELVSTFTTQFTAQKQRHNDSVKGLGRLLSFDGDRHY